MEEVVRAEEAIVRADVVSRGSAQVLQKVAVTTPDLESRPQMEGGLSGVQSCGVYLSELTMSKGFHRLSSSKYQRG